MTDKKEKSNNKKYSKNSTETLLLVLLTICLILLITYLFSLIMIKFLPNTHIIAFANNIKYIYNNNCLV